MTLREKTTIEKKLIREFLKSLKISKPSKDIVAGNFLRDLVREICITEIEYYGFKCGRLSGNDVLLDLYYVDNEKITADFEVSYHMDSFSRVYTDTPRIRINFGGLYLNAVFSDDSKIRVDGGKEVLDALFHEIKHFRKEMLKRSGYSSKENLRNAKESLILFFRHDVYSMNHDRFSEEADADNYASITRQDLGVETRMDVSLPIITEADKAFACYMVPEKGYVEREAYLNSQADFILRNGEGALLYWKLWTILHKEYDSDLNRLSLSDMITNFIAEINETIKTIDDPKERNIVIKDIREMYYEMFNRTIIIGNRLELYEAIKKHGINSVREILVAMKHYNSSEKRRKIDLLKRKQESVISILSSGNYIRPNIGYIIDPRKHNGESVRVEDYIKTLINRFSGLSNEMREFILSREFLGRIPLFGSYTFNSGKKVSIYDFIQDYLIPELSKRHPKDYMNAYMEVVMCKTKPHFDVEAQYNIEVVNKDFQGKNHAIEECLELPIMKESKLKEFEEDHDSELVNDMMTVLKICDGDNTVFRRFKTSEIFLGGSRYYILKPEQLAYLDKLVEAASILSKDEVLNPFGYNYEHKLKMTPEFSKISTNMDEYKKANQNRLIIL